MSADIHRVQRGPFDQLRTGGARACLGSEPMRTRRKAWQCGHCRCQRTGSGGGAATTTGFCSSVSTCIRRRFAEGCSHPKYLTRCCPGGSTCRRYRRRNSAALSVQSFFSCVARERTGSGR